MFNSFKLSAVCGCSYKSGNIIFLNTKNHLISPVGNRVTMIDLDANVTSTLNFETRSDIAILRASADDSLLIAVDNDGFALGYSLLHNRTVCHFRFKKALADLRFSPDNKFVAVGFDREIRVYETPGQLKVMEPFVQVKKINTSHGEDISGLFWSPDSRFVCTSARDCTVYMHNVFSLPQYVTQKFVGHRKRVLQVFFQKQMERCYTMGKDAVMYIWEWKTDVITSEYKNRVGFENVKRGKKLKLAGEYSETATMMLADELGFEAAESNPLMSHHENNFKLGRWVLESKKQFFQDGTQLSTAEYSYIGSLLLLGYKNGVFALYRVEGPEVSNLHIFSASEKKITHLAFNHTAEWMALASEEDAQLMVWEWRSQSCSQL